MLFLMLAAVLALPQQTDLDSVLAKADKLLEEAKAAYDAAKAGGSAKGAVQAGFKGAGAAASSSAICC